MTPLSFILAVTFNASSASVEAREIACKAVLPGFTVSDCLEIMDSEDPLQAALEKKCGKGEEGQADWSGGPITVHCGPEPKHRFYIHPKRGSPA